jgi:hypothetical protein
MLKHCLLAAAFVLVAMYSFAQQTGSYRSKQNGNWNAYTTWEKFDGTNWIDLVSGDYPNNATLDVTIQAHTVTVTTTAPAPPYKMRNLTVQSGGKLYANANVVTPRYLQIFGNISVTIQLLMTLGSALKEAPAPLAVPVRPHRSP